MLHLLDWCEHKRLTVQSFYCHQFVMFLCYCLGLGPIEGVCQMTDVNQWAQALYNYSHIYNHTVLTGCINKFCVHV